MIPSLPTRNNYTKKKSASSIDSSVRSYSTHSTFGGNNVEIKLLPTRLRSWSVPKSSLGFLDQSSHGRPNSLNVLMAKKMEKREGVDRDRDRDRNTQSSFLLKRKRRKKKQKKKKKREEGAAESDDDDGEGGGEENGSDHHEVCRYGQ